MKSLRKLVINFDILRTNLICNIRSQLGRSNDSVCNVSSTSIKTCVQSPKTYVKMLAMMACACNPRAWIMERER